MELTTTAFTTTTVWVVDDDAYILKIFQHILTKNQVPHHCFESAEALLETAWDTSVQCVISDIRLPGKNGDELCRLLRQQHPELTIVALTTQADDAERAAFAAAGFDDVFLKPFTEAHLLALLSRETAKDILSFPLLDALIEDESERAEIIRQFVEETQHDLLTLEQAVSENEAATVSLIVHRLAGRLAQFSQEQLSDAFRLMERKLLATPDPEQHIEELEELMDALDGFLKKVGGALKL